MQFDVNVCCFLNPGVKSVVYLNIYWVMFITNRYKQPFSFESENSNFVFDCMLCFWLVQKLISIILSNKTEEVWSKIWLEVLCN